MAFLIPLCLPALVLVAPAPVARQAPPARLSDAQIEALAKSAMASEDSEVQADVLKQLQTHHFKSSQAPEREAVLGVQGLLEDRAGKTAQAAATFRKLEQTWPHSPYLAEGQVIMADAALERKRYQDAQGRLHRALEADLPVESQRRAQELLLWCLAEQGQAAQGGAILKALKPLGTAKPSERGLVGIMEALCADRQNEAAGTTLKTYHRLFPKGPRTQRMDLDWAKLLGATGEPRAAALGFQRLIQDAPATPEADEARLALATLLTDGKLLGKEAEGFPAAQALLAGMNKEGMKEGPARQAQLVKARIAFKEGRWKDVLDTVGQYRTLHPSPSELAQANALRAEAMGKWVQEVLDRHQSSPILPYLNGEGIRSLTPALRLGLTRRLALGGLPEAARAILPVAPASERPALLKAALEGANSAGNPHGSLDLLPGKGETPAESLIRAQADVALRDWAGARGALARASAGPERIRVLVGYLTRPFGTGETPALRLREVDTWLARAREPGADREPLAILAGDLRVRTGDWRGALARYPAQPQPANRGWVLLMRATCQARLGQNAPALATLKQAGDDATFRKERDTLSQRLSLTVPAQSSR